MNQSQNLTAALKEYMKRKGVTYRALGEALGLTESAMKRAFSHASFSLRRLDQICQHLEVDFLTLAKLSKKSSDALEILNAEQEKTLAENEELFVVFYLIVAGIPVEKIPGRFRFTAARARELAGVLVNLGLIRETAKGAYASRVSQSVLWQRGGPLFLRYEHQVKREFFEADFTGDNESLWYLAGNISPHSLKRIESRFQSLLDEIRETIVADEALFPSSELKNFAMICGLRPWVFSLIDQYRKKRK